MIALLSALLAAAGPSPQDAVRAADVALDRAVAAGDGAAFAALLEKEVTFGGARRLSRGRDAVVAAWKPLFSAKGAKLRWAPVRAEVAGSGDLAFTTGRWTLESKEYDGKPRRDAGEYVTVWRRSGGGRWRVLLDAPLTPAAKLGEGLVRTPVLAAASAAGDLDVAMGTWTRGVDEGGYLTVRRRSAGSWAVEVDSAFTFLRPAP
jgi:ketosteroid isomerase-like protein